MKIVYYLARGKESLQRLAKRVKKATGADLLFVEQVEERKESWPVLQQAIHKALSSTSILHIANIGKLDRSPTFLRPLKETGVKFECGDNDVLCDRNVAVQYAFAEEWVRNLAATMRDAMSKSREQGVKFGFAKRKHRGDKRCVAGALKGSENAARARTERARRAYSTLLPKIESMRTEGENWDNIVERLNKEGHRSTTGAPLNRPTLIRLYQRARGIEPRRRNEEAEV